MAQINALVAAKFTEHRRKSGAPVAADAAVDASNPDRRGLLGTRNWDRFRVRVKIAGAGTVTLQPLLYDEDDDGFVASASSGALADGDSFDVDCFQFRSFLRIAAVGGAPTLVVLRVAPLVRTPQMQA